MKLETLAAYVRRPAGLLVKIRMDVYNRFHPGEPWLAPGAIRFCAGHLTDEMRGLEWGSGRSTAWFGARLGSLVSVEHNPAWYEQTSRRVREAGLGNVDLRLVGLPADLDELMWKNSPYVAVVEEFSDSSLDFVVVDGLFRQECVARVLPKIAPGGYLLVDDTAHLSRLEDWGVPASWPVVLRSRFLVAETTIWQKPS